MPYEKIKSVSMCQECGGSFPKWMGKCPDCGSWNSLVEEKISKKARSTPQGKLSSVPISLDKIELHKETRTKTDISELDRVLGGGMVRGGVVLVGGDPGIGKSTLLLEVAEKVAEKRGKVLYVTGEESATQIKLRAERMKISSSQIQVLTETDLFIILNVLKRELPVLAVIDSIQTMNTQELESAPGSISQIRECTARLLAFGKAYSCSLFLIGHVTKDGAIAGPRVLEHMVDTVLYFEGDKNYAYRILRAVKNRFGPSGEIGVFQMEEKGLKEITNPSQVFLSERNKNLSGSAVVCAMEGTRPILLEVQALTSPTSYGMPQKVASGVDYKRLALLLAILEKRIGINIGTFDVFVNVAGGIRVEEPAIDLGILVAIVSSFKDMPVDQNTVVIGEVGLDGEVRAVSHIQPRIKEAQKLGFKRCVIPMGNKKNLNQRFEINNVGVGEINETINLALT
ncbi:MAG: DNA repair protein RadA, partial [Candidatus Zixiibacteriota bacterium]